jgi:hypothetical protein
VFYYAFEAMISGELRGMLFTVEVAQGSTIPNVTGETFLGTLGEGAQAGRRRRWLPRARGWVAGRRGGVVLFRPSCLV